MKSEANPKKDIKDWLDTLEDCYHIPYHNMGYGTRGTADRLALYKGCFFAIEVKHPDRRGKASPFQLGQRKRVIAAGGVSLIACDVEEVKQAFRERGLS